MAAVRRKASGAIYRTLTQRGAAFLGGREAGARVRADFVVSAARPGEGLLELVAGCIARTLRVGHQLAARGRRDDDPPS